MSTEPQGPSLPPPGSAHTPPEGVYPLPEGAYPPAEGAYPPAESAYQREAAEVLTAPLPEYPEPDIAFRKYRLSLVWPAVTVLFALASIVLIPIILGPVAIICGLVAISRGERFSRTVLAFAVACMLTGLIFGALVLHHHHHSLVSHVTFL